MPEPHSGHLDAELNKPEELTNQRLTDIACQCLQRWDSYPTLPGSRRWSVNGRTALRELDRRLGNLEEQLQTALRERDEIGVALGEPCAECGHMDWRSDGYLDNLLHRREDDHARLLEQYEVLAASERGAWAARDELQEQLEAAHALIRKTIYQTPGYTGPDVWWKAEADELLGGSNPASAPVPTDPVDGTAGAEGSSFAVTDDPLGIVSSPASVPENEA